jgi:hypothetical protein
MKKIVVLFVFIFAASASFAQTAKDSVAILKEFAGTYKMKEIFGKYTVVYKDGALYAEADSYGENKIIPQATANTFQSTSSYGTIVTFVRDEKKKVVGVKLKLMDQEVEGDKEN